MKKYSFCIAFFLLLFVPVLSIFSQDGYKGNIILRQESVYQEEDNLIINALIDISKLKLGKQQMVTLTPYLSTNDDSDNQVYTFQPVIITGKTRNKAVKRSITLDGFEYENEPILTELRRNGKKQSIPVKVIVPYESWIIHNGSMNFNEVIEGCVNCELISRNNAGGFEIILSSSSSRYDICYIIPPAEQLKLRNETYSAYINFQAGSYNIIRTYKNNSVILDEVDRIVSDIKQNTDISIANIHVVGYASPEGSYEQNMSLSANRARAFVNYLSSVHNIGQANIQVDWRGEDWQGLRKALQESSISEKARVISIIDKVYDIGMRKATIQSLFNGDIYKELQNKIYPNLRRNEYTISYSVRAFDTNEARELIKTNPKLLSLSELYLLANSYTRGSSEFREIFHTALNLYPNDVNSMINKASLDIEEGAIDQGIEALLNIDRPEAWNNLGIGYIYKNDYEKAEYYLTKAANAGNATAKANLEKFINTRPR